MVLSKAAMGRYPTRTEDQVKTVVDSQHCVQCGAHLIEEARYCHRCGRSTQRLPQVERRWCTVLFADVRDFTTLSEGLDPEIVQNLMNTLFGRLSAVVESHGGSVDKIIGDAIMALFGVPKAGGDDAERAVRCGLAIHSVCAAVADELGLTLQMRVGINTGEVIAGSLGRASEYTVIGDTVNVAARLESAGKAGQVLVGSATAQQVRQRYELTPVGELHLKGRAAPEAAYLVLGENLSSRDDTSASLALIGRRAELSRLTDLHAAEGCEVVLLTSEPGGGRGRLIQELSDKVGEYSSIVLERHADPLPAELPLRILSTLSADVDAPHVSGAKLGAWLGDEAGAHRVLRCLQSGVVDELDVEAWKTVFQHDGFPGLIVVEEAQRIDARSARWIELLKRYHHRGLVVLCAHQEPVLRERLGEQLSATIETVELSAMTSDEVAQWLTMALGSVDPVLCERFHRTSGGNPSHMNELLRVWRLEGVMIESDAGWVLDEDRVREVQVPGSLRELLQARIDALPRTPRYLLQRCAAVGQVFWKPVAVEVAIGDAAEVSAALDYLVEYGWLEEFVDPQLPMATAYRFRALMVAEVASRMLPLSLRRTIHAKVAQWLQVSGAELTTGLRTVLARHLMLAQSEEDASALYEKLAADALQAGDASAAAEALSQAAAGATGNRQASLRLERAELLWLRSAQIDDAIAALRALLSGSTMPAALQMRARCVLAQVEMEAGRPAEADRALGAAEGLSESVHDAEALAYLRLTRAEVDQMRGGWSQAGRAIDLLEDGEGLPVSARRQAEILRARHELFEGRYLRAAARLDEALGDDDEAHQLELLLDQIWASLHLQRAEEGRRLAGRAQAVLAQSPAEWFQTRLVVLNALLDHEELGSVASERAFEEAVSRADELGMKRYATEAIIWRMHRCAERGEEGADGLARRLLERTTAAWTTTGRALACALVASASQSLEEALRAECLISLPGPVHLRRNALARLADLGAIFDPELRRRCERLAGSLEVA